LKNGVNSLNQVGWDEWNMHKTDDKYIHNFGSDTARSNNLLDLRRAAKIY
jgi:hypothetical protein